MSTRRLMHGIIIIIQMLKAAAAAAVEHTRLKLLCRASDRFQLEFKRQG